MFFKIGVLKSFATLLGCNFIKKEIPTQAFYCEYCATFKSSFFIEYLRWLLFSLQKISRKNTCHSIAIGDHNEKNGELEKVKKEQNKKIM